MFVEAESRIILSFFYFLFYGFIFSVADKPYDTKLEATIPDNVGVINSSVILNCTANANPPVTAYNIYHNGNLVSNASTGVHNITRALAEHNGSYVCVPYNDFGPGERAALNVTFVGQLHENETRYKQ